MYKYKIYGITFESDLELPECEAVSLNESAEVVLRYSELEDIVESVGTYIKEIENQGKTPEELPTRYTKWEGTKFCAVVVNVGCFRVSDGTLVEYRPFVSKDSALFHQWVLAYASTIALIQRHKLILHCAGLLIPDTDDVFLVCGESGAGKSTISDALLKKGFLFVSDDSVRVALDGNKVEVFGSNMQRRLCPDVVEKEGIDVNSLEYYEEGNRIKYLKTMKDCYYGNVPHKLTKVFILGKYNGNGVSVNEVTGVEKVNVLLSQLYKYAVYSEMNEKTKIYMQAINIVKEIKLYKIYRPENGETVDEIKELISNLVNT